MTDFFHQIKSSLLSDTSLDLQSLDSAGFMGKSSILPRCSPLNHSYIFQGLLKLRLQVKVSRTQQSVVLGSSVWSSSQLSHWHSSFMNFNPTLLVQLLRVSQTSPSYPSGLTLNVSSSERLSLDPQSQVGLPISLSWLTVLWLYVTHHNL